MRSGTSTAGAVVGGALLLLAARRILIAAAALAPPRPLARSADLPGVVLLVPARNEEASLARLLPAPSVVLTSSRSAADLGAALRDAPACGFVAKAALSGAAIQALVARRP